jgi:hypothetical protein
MRISEADLVLDAPFVAGSCLNSETRMKFGIRTPSLGKRIAARTSVKRYIRHSLGLKAPRGWGWLTNPRRAAYNRIYNRTTVGCVVLPAVMVAGCILWLVL